MLLVQVLVLVDRLDDVARVNRLVALHLNGAQRVRILKEVAGVHPLFVRALVRHAFNRGKLGLDRGRFVYGELDAVLDALACLNHSKLFDLGVLKPCMRILALHQLIGNKARCTTGY